MRDRHQLKALKRSIQTVEGELYLLRRARAGGLDPNQRLAVFWMIKLSSLALATLISGMVSVAMAVQAISDLQRSMDRGSFDWGVVVAMVISALLCVAAIKYGRLLRTVRRPARIAPGQLDSRQRQLETEHADLIRTYEAVKGSMES